MNNKWEVYEANVQAYRASMIASQSFLLAAGTFSIDRTVLGCTCVGIALFQLWFIWFRVIRVRTIISDFYKFDLSSKFYKCGERMRKKKKKKRISSAFNMCKEVLDEDTYVKDRQIRKKVNSKLAEELHKPKLKHNMRYSRIKIDLILPISFTILWIIILLYILRVI